MIANILVEHDIKSHDSIFTYRIPSFLLEKTKVGVRVIIPFVNRKIEGLVLKIGEEKKVDYKLKDIIEVIDQKPIINDEMLNLGKYISEKYLSSLSSSYKVMFPKGFKLSINNNVNDKVVKYIKRLRKEEFLKTYIKNNKLGVKQKEVLEKLIKEEKILKKTYNKSTLKKLIKENLIEVIEEQENRFLYESDIKTNEKKLTDDQLKVFKSVNLNQKQTYLIHGVTGSGKTEIYLQLIKDVIKEGKTALFLLPEIALTTQMIEIFYQRFQSDLAVLHSKLSVGEKYDEYKKILNEEVKIVIGARSAIFAPLKNIGIIIIDEEHEGTYKQENNPKYHVLDLAKKRSEYNNCPLILGSATPSLESYARAKKGVYKLLELPKRINDINMPEVEIIDMTKEYKKRNFIFSDNLVLKIEEKLKKDEQVILLLNRRGYSNYIMCPNCGYVHKCPNCDVSLTYHKKTNKLKCHYCNYEENNLLTCPECNNKMLRNVGMGTEKLAEEIENKFNTKALRIDLDTTRKKDSFDKMLTSFKNKEYSILLGTQMIAKGLDFKNVTLVGVLNADYALNIPDFRSSENTFQLLTQVAGRSGRAKKGEVIIQTFNPDHYSIDFAKEHNFNKFYEKELNLRHKMKYPPFYYLTLIKISSKEENLAFKHSKKISNYLNKELKEVIILGPSMAGLFKINNQFRYKIILKYKDEEKIRKALKTIQKQYQVDKNIKIDIDINPIRM